MIKSTYKIERKAEGMQNMISASKRNCCRPVNYAGDHTLFSLSRACFFFFFAVLGLKDILGELPKREASSFRSQVSFQLAGCSF